MQQTPVLGILPCFAVGILFCNNARNKELHSNSQNLLPFVQYSMYRGAMEPTWTSGGGYPGVLCIRLKVIIALPT
jgi:hypothetical protein